MGRFLFFCELESLKRVFFFLTKKKTKKNLEIKDISTTLFLSNSKQMKHYFHISFSYIYIYISLKKTNRFC